MRDVLDRLESWWSRGRPVALATVVGTFRSAPRQPGASMLVGPDGEAVGSVSGGCVEGAVYELGSGVLDGSEDATLQRYGVSDDDAFAVGLTCGGILDVFVERVDPQTYPQLGAVAAAVRQGRPVAVATVVSGPHERVGRRLVVWPEDLGERSDGKGGGERSDGNGGGERSDGNGGGERSDGNGGGERSDGTGDVEGGTGSTRLDDAVRDDARGLLAAGRSAMISYGTDGQRRGEGLAVFVESFAPPPRLVVFGAIDFAAAVARIGAFLGMRVTVCDARPVFATTSRFPEAHEVVVEWPHRYLRAEAEAGRVDGRTSLAVLTHDPKFDVPLLEVALRLPEIGYIGAMGSRRTHDDRRSRLLERGVTEAELARLASPIGLDLGARTPEETAVSIAAEMIARQWGGEGVPLSRRGGPIHSESAVEPGMTSADDGDEREHPAHA